MMNIVIFVNLWPYPITCINNFYTMNINCTHKSSIMYKEVIYSLEIYFNDFEKSVIIFLYTCNRQVYNFFLFNAECRYTVVVNSKPNYFKR